MPDAQMGRAAWSDSTGAPFVVRDAPNWPVGDDEMKIRIHAIAINPADHKLLDTRTSDQEWPVIFGIDGAGEVVEVGKKVQHFVKGDRIAALFTSVVESLGNKEATFQEYAVVRSVRAFKIPDALSYADAATLPVAIATVSVPFFAPEVLNLEVPRVEKAVPNGKVLLVWSGSSSVGAAAVQLASHAGYEVYATASPKNFELVKSMGASRVFDYNDSGVVENIVAALRGREQDYVGAYSATHGTFEGVTPAVHVATGLGIKDSLVACSNPAVTQDGVPEGVVIVGNTSLQCFQASGPFPGHPEIGQAIFGNWLPKALAAKSVRATPPAQVVGHGLEAINDAVDIVRKGQNSGVKIVVTL